MKKILVIEDDNSIRENIIDLLEVNSFQAFSASNGKEGLKLAAEIKPNLILCDIMMPGIDGYEVKSKIIEDKNNRLTPFIFLTAKSEIEDIRKGMQLGVDDYIVKPFDNKELIKSINIRLEKHKLLIEESANSTTKTIISNETTKDKILITVNNQPRFIEISKIMYIESNGNYTWIYPVTGKKMMVHKLLKAWEEFLPENNFMRIHQSYIINLNYIENIEKLSQRSFIVRMKNMSKPLPISQRYTAKIKTKFQV